MNIHSGKKIYGYRFTELSMPQHIIDKVHALADAEGTPDLDEDGCPLFKLEIGAPVNAEEKAMPITLDKDDDSEEDDNNDDAITDDKDDNDDDDNDDESIESNNNHEDSNDDKTISDEDEPPDPQLKGKSNDESLTDDSVESVNELMSEIDAENVVEGKRNRTATTQPNIASFGGKKYHVNMLNIDAVTQFE